MSTPTPVTSPTESCTSRPSASWSMFLLSSTLFQTTRQMLTDTHYGLANRLKKLFTFTTSFPLSHIPAYCCVTVWIFVFLFLATSCWLIWIGLHIWSVIQAYRLYTQFNNGGMANEVVVEFDQSISVVSFTLIVSTLMAYWFYWWIDQDSPEEGSHPQPYLRTLPLWRQLRDYFPVRLILSKDIQSVPRESVDRPDCISSRLATCSPMDNQITVCPNLFPADRNYLVGYHPHGIFGVGAFVNFGTEANDFSKKFPGLTPWLTTLQLNFKAPFHRDLLQKFNIVAATYKGITHLLDPNRCGGVGNFIVVVLGGAPEALDSRPGKYVFHTNRRFGFFKLALMTGSTLVPCVSFGEPNMYRQVSNPKGGSLRTFQDRFTELATFSPPIFYARALLPYRTPVTTVVGVPIPLEKVEQPSRDQVASLKKLYLERLDELFRQHKPIYDPGSDEVVYF